MATIPTIPTLACTNTERKEATERPDSIWLSLSAGKQTPEETCIVNFDQINDINGNFGDFKAAIVVGIPLYGTADDVLHTCTKYIFNQIEIFEKTKENKELFTSIGGNG